MDGREGSFLQDHVVGEGGVLRGIWVNKQCHSLQAIPMSLLQFGSPSMKICRGVCICICLSLQTCENQLLRCYQATATELSRRAAAPTSSRAGPSGRFSRRNSTARVFGDSTVGKYTLVYISCYIRGMFSSPGSSSPRAAWDARSGREHVGEEAGCAPARSSQHSHHTLAPRRGC